MALYPGRVSRWVTGIVDGVTVNIPLFHKSQKLEAPSTSYFIQATSGHQINDVVHAKLIDPHGQNLILTNCTDRLGTYYVPCGSGTIGNMLAAWVSSYRGLYFVQMKYRTSSRWVGPIRYTRFRDGEAFIAVVLRPPGPTNQQEGWGYTELWTLSITIGPTVAPISSKSGSSTLIDVFPYASVGMDTGLSIPASEEYSDPDFDWDSLIRRRWQDTLLAWAESGLRIAYESFKDGSKDNLLRRRTPTQARAIAKFDPAPDLSQSFLFGENWTVGYKVDAIALGNGMANNLYWKNWLIQHAYVDALQNAPRLNDNSISNIIELVGFIKALVVDHKIEMPKSLQDAWLSYRYVYNTTKLDVSEAIKFVKRNLNLGGLNRAITSRGISRHDLSLRGGEEIVPIECRCTLELEPATIGYVDRIWRALYTYGLQPNFYVVWDMIPYSFIVDWFIPVGDIASTLDLEANMLRGQYNIRNVCFSLSYTREFDDYNIKLFTRWQSKPLTSINNLYWFDGDGPSNRVKWYRILDTISLVSG